MKIEEIDLDKQDTPEEVEAKLEDQLQVKFLDLRQALEAYTQEHSQKLAEGFNTLAPYEDYKQLLEEQSDIASFLKTDASQPQNWALASVEETDTRLISELLLELMFDNLAVEDLKGFIYVGANGKIKHVFVRGEQ